MEDFEQYENLERSDTPFELDEFQQQTVDMELNQVGGEELLNGIENRDAVIETYDRAIKQIRPDLKTAANLSPMKSYNQVWNDFINNYLESPYIESISDKQQVELISDYMVDVEDIRYENWKDLSLNQQIEVLNNMEQHIAKIEHRPPTMISTEYMDRAEVFGYQLGDDIVINTSYMEIASKDPAMLDQLLDTLIHEGRHRYQHYNVEERLVHESPAEVETWRENFEVLGYADGTPVTIQIAGPFEYTDEYLSYVGARLYYYQPVEIDARDFAKDVMIEYRKKMEA